MSNKQNIWVYASWQGMGSPKLIGNLGVQQARGKSAFSFKYEGDWLNQKDPFLLDPDINWFAGQQHPLAKENFGMILDSMPDTWGRTLMRRRALLESIETGKKYFETKQAAT